MHVLVIENYPHTSLGLLGQALDEAGADVRIRRAHLGEPLPPDDAGFDALVLLGGGQSALDDAEHPYLPAEAELARLFGATGKAVLGICLGAQLVARAYGARNILGRPLEFGWHPVRATRSGSRDPVISALGAATSLFHWHADTFSLPPGAAHLAESDMTRLQAFSLGRAVYGIQFHFEAGRQLVTHWADVFAGEIDASRPGWRESYQAEAARHGAAADAAGLELARAWLRLVVR